MNKSTNQSVFRSFLLALCISSAAAAAFAQSTAFTYQGRLQDGGSPATGNYDFQFTLWDALSGGSQQPPSSPITVSLMSVPVTGGVFTVQLDFGAAAFPGANRWLEVNVRPVGAGSFTTLSPRQPIASTPYALRSASAGTADAATNATQLGGMSASQYVLVSDSRLSDARAPTAGSANYIQNTTTPQAGSNFNISGDGTAGGTLSGNTVNSSTTLNIAGNKVMSVTGDTNFPTSNTFVGVGSGIKTLPNSNGDGDFNSFYGNDAGFFNTTGKANSFFGSVAGQSNTTGTFNSFFGMQAGANTTTGSNNSLFGFSAGFNNPTGHDNSIFGVNAGRNQTGNFNTYIGGQAGQTASGDANTFVGFNTAGQGQSSQITLVGYSARLGSANLTNATAIGAGAVVSSSNSLVLGPLGTNVGIGTVSPSARLHVVGDTNLVGNLTVSGTLNATLPTDSASYIQNTSSQQASSNFNISGNGTIGGTLSGNIVNAATQYNINGIRVLSISGGGVLQNSNTFAGIFAGNANTPGANDQTGNSNSFFGSQAGVNNITGSANSFFGYIAGRFTTTGIGNSFYGQGAGRSSNGNSNSFFGASAGGFFFTTPSAGSRNSFFGANAGLSNNSGDDNTLLGYSADVASDNLANATAIGANAFVSQSNCLILGSINGVNAATADTNVGIGTTSPNVRLEVRGNGTVASDWQQGQFRISGQSNSARQLSLGYDTSANVGAIQSGEANVQFTTLVLNPQGGSVGIGTAAPDQKLSVNGNASKTGGGSWLSFSDERLKDIRGRFAPGLNAVMRLQPIRYEYKPDNVLGIKSEGEHIGFSAQQVQQIVPEAVSKNDKGYLLVNNDPILWTMLNAIKEQQAQIEKQQKQIDELKKVACRSHAKARVCR